MILSFAGFVSVAVEDKYGNPISNIPVDFTVLQPVEQTTCSNPNQDTSAAYLIKTEEPCIKDIPVWGECGKSTTQTLPVLTSPYGAAVEIVLGGVPGAEYPIEAVAGQLREVFHLYTYPFGNCDGDTEPAVQLVLQYTYPADPYGNNIDAGSPGSKIPLKARMYYLVEKGTNVDVTINCGSDTKVCPRTVGSRQYEVVTGFKDATVTFSGMEGTPEGKGIYTAMYTLQPGLNTIEIQGSASMEQTRAVPICPDCEERTETITQTAAATMEVYGVEVEIQPLPVVLLNELGFIREDYRINYTITPPQYRAYSGYLIIYKDKTAVEYIPIEPEPEGTVILSRGFWFDAEAGYEIEIVLNYGTGVEIRSGRVPLKIVQLYIEKEDPEYPDVKLRWNDYYPALGGKIVTVRTTQNSLEGNVLTCNILQSTLDALADINPSATVTCETVDQQITEGRMRFRLTAEGIGPMINNDPATGLDEIEIGISLQKDGNIYENVIEATYNIKNNHNTTLGEVLEGEAVFVYDRTFAENHRGKTVSTVTGDDKKKIDFVQEMLNQVIPRKRSAVDYVLIGEDGYYGDETADAISKFKSSFNIEVNTGLDNLTDIYRKLMKDYGLEGREAEYLDRIIDKQVLVGKVERTDRAGTVMKDELINGTGTASDTGLYELYANVVRPFIEAMIQEAERYAGIRGAAVPTDNWVARTGQGNMNSTNPHGPGMSYCYGCKDDIESFNRTVANCRAEMTEEIRARETDDIIGNEYRGNINETCAIEPGTTKDWAGLYSREYVMWAESGRISQHPFNPVYWAGIDCSGLVQRVIENGRKVVSGINITIPSPPDWIGSGAFFTDDTRVYYIQNPSSAEDRVRVQRKIHRGDLVRYNGHISIVYSDRPECTRSTDSSGEEQTNCSYEIIHAYGGDENGEYTCPDIPEASENRGRTVFGRKVMRTWDNIGIPKGFGRIKLWN